MSRNVLNGVPCRIASGPQTPEDVGSFHNEMSDEEVDMHMQIMWEESLIKEEEEQHGSEDNQGR